MIAEKETGGSILKKKGRKVIYWGKNFKHKKMKFFHEGA